MSVVTHVQASSVPTPAEPGSFASRMMGALGVCAKGTAVVTCLVACATAVPLMIMGAVEANKWEASGGAAGLIVGGGLALVLAKCGGSPCQGNGPGA